MSFGLEITNEVIDWCKSQHFAHDYEGMTLIGVALACWLTYWITLDLEKWITLNSDSERKLAKFLNWCSLELAFLLTLGFAILFLVTKNGI